LFLNNFFGFIIIFFNLINLIVNFLRRFPVLHVYHPDQTDGKLGHDFASLGWAGLIGALTGISSADVGMCKRS
jgi:hypothetical protein